jgi:ADP-heptose:LPS heptosyltransferase
LMSAPFALNLGLDDLPYRERYQTPASRDIDLGPSHVPDAKLKVGIAWCGSPTHVNDAFRSTTIEKFAPLFQIPQIAFYSLQLGAQADDMNNLLQHAPVVRDLSNLQHDIADAAAIVRQLDLVITVDTSILHLCGGLGLPVWGLISRRGDWRWLGNEHTDSVWYRSLRLFRQQRLNDWDELMQRVATELRQLSVRTSTGP